MTAERQESGNRLLGSWARAGRSDGGEADESSPGLRQATEALEKARSVIDQASQAMRDLTHGNGRWVQGAVDRAVDMAVGLRSQSERAVSTVSQQVEHNPMTSVAIAFAIGFLCATLARR